MISPDANRIGFGQQAARFPDPLACLKYVTNDNDPIHLLLAKAVEGDAKQLDLFVDVGYEAEPHQSCSVRRLGKIVERTHEDRVSLGIGVCRNVFGIFPEYWFADVVANDTAS